LGLLYIIPPSRRIFKKANQGLDYRRFSNPTLYFGISLGLTFPFNIPLGIPLYVHVTQH
jgi:hypothetical protein